jgi:hypothetical protein
MNFSKNITRPTLETVMEDLHLENKIESRLIHSPPRLHQGSSLRNQVNFEEPVINWVNSATNDKLEQNFEWEDYYTADSPTQEPRENPDNLLPIPPQDLSYILGSSVSSIASHNSNHSEETHRTRGTRVSTARCESPYSSGAAHRIFIVADTISKLIESNTDYDNSNSDIKITVSDGLGSKSQAFNGIGFMEGGGCIIDYVKRTPFTQTENDNAFKKKLAGWRNAKKNNPKAKNIPTPIQRELAHTVNRKIELHPPGGMHSNYRNHNTPRGSYVRITNISGPTYLESTTIPAQKTENRYGRHGSFDSDKTVNQQDISTHKPTEDFKPTLVAPNLVASGNPSPEAAHKILDALFIADKEKVEQILNVLSNEDLSWVEISKRIDEITPS